LRHVTFDEDRNRFTPETWVGTWEDTDNALKRLSIKEGNVETGDKDVTSAAESSGEESVYEEVRESTNGTLRRSSRETRPPGYEGLCDCTGKGRAI